MSAFSISGLVASANCTGPRASNRTALIIAVSKGLLTATSSVPFSKRGRHDEVLEGDLGGDLVAHLRGDGELGQFQVGPVQPARKLLQEQLLRQPALAADEGQQRLLRAVVRRHRPGLAPLVELVGRDLRDVGEEVLY